MLLYCCRVETCGLKVVSVFGTPETSCCNLGRYVMLLMFVILMLHLRPGSNGKGFGWGYGRFRFES